MPRKDVDYSKTLMYKIVCNDLNIKELYVGSTTNFRNRKASHKSRCNNEQNKCFNFKIYKIIRENGGWENWSMFEIEKFPCKDGNESVNRERYWFEELHSRLNTKFPIRLQTEYIKTNTELLRDRKRESAQKCRKEKGIIPRINYTPEQKKENEKKRQAIYYQKRKNLKMNENNIED